MNAKLSLNYHPLKTELWVSGCLVFFAKRYVKNPSPLLKELCSELNHDQLLAEYCQASVVELSDSIPNLDLQLLDIPGGIKKWLSTDRISSEELFTLCFITELDNHYNLNLLLQELQGPQQDNQLSLHFLCDFLAAIFSIEIKPSAIQHWQSVKQGLLVIQKRGPLILSHIQLEMNLWQLCLSPSLAMREVQHQVLQPAPGVLLPIDRLAQKSPGILVDRFNLSAEQQDIIDQLAIAIRLQHYSRVALIADQFSATQFASALAQSLNVTSLMPELAWKNRFAELCLLANIHDWLLVLDQSIWSSELVSIEAKQPLLIYSSDQSLEPNPLASSDHKTFFYQLQQNSYTERIASWRLITSDAQAKDFASRWLIDKSRIESLIQAVNHSPIQSSSLVEKIASARLAKAPANLLDLAFHISMPVNVNSVILQKRVERDLQSLLQRCLQRENVFSGLGGNLVQQASAGVKALFSGESGTGKTLAATVLAHQLGIPLYRLDLGSILNKYVGETEKNIHKLLEKISAEDYILLIDEADALFGKRTDAESGGERFANMLTNYLLARIEQHQGIVLMTTNGLGRIDPAFMRRFDKVIEFMPPEFDERMAIWKSLLGERNPGDAYCRQLASLCELSGGFIRNAVLSAAAEVSYQQQTLIPYCNLLTCLAREYVKSGKPVPPKLTQHLSQQLLNKEAETKEENIKEALL